MHSIVLGIHTFIFKIWVTWSGQPSVIGHSLSLSLEPHLSTSLSAVLIYLSCTFLYWKLNIMPPTTMISKTKRDSCGWLTLHRCLINVSWIRNQAGKPSVCKGCRDTTVGGIITARPILRSAQRNWSSLCTQNASLGNHVLVSFLSRDMWNATPATDLQILTQSGEGSEGMQVSLARKEVCCFWNVSVWATGRIDRLQ